MSGGNIRITSVDLDQARKMQEQTSSLGDPVKSGNGTVRDGPPNDGFKDVNYDNALNNSQRDNQNRSVNLQKQASFSGNITIVRDMKVSEEPQKNAPKTTAIIVDDIIESPNNQILSSSEMKRKEPGDADNKAVSKELRHEITNPKKSQRSMDEALDMLWGIETHLNEATKRKLDFKTESGFWGTLKNAFCKFLGFFSKSFEERRTNELNNQIDKITTEIKNNTEFGQKFLENVIMSIMRDKDIDEELKTTCFKLFDDDPAVQKEVFQKLEKPNANIVFGFLNHHRSEIKGGKLFGTDVCRQWLGPSMNEKNTTEEIKLKLYTLLDNDPDIQDKLFRSLKEPPKKIKEKFWEKHKQEILSGSIFGYGKDQNPYGVSRESAIKGLFFNNTHPLAALFLTMVDVRSDLDKSIFAKKENWSLMANDEDKKHYMKAACSLTREQVLQSLESVNKVERQRVAEDKSTNIQKVLDFLQDPTSKEIDESNLNPTVVKDKRRGMNYSFVFGETKIVLTDNHGETDDSNGFFKELKEKLWDNSGKCLLDKNQLKQLVDFIFYSPSQGYLASQLDGIVYVPFGGKASVQVAFYENKGPVVTIQDENTYEFLGFIFPLGLSDFEEPGLKPFVHTSGTLKLTYEEPINASNVNAYTIFVENYNEDITFEKP